MGGRAGCEERKGNCALHASNETLSNNIYNIRKIGVNDCLNLCE